MEGCIQSLTDDLDIELSVEHSIIFLKCTLKHETIISKKKLVKMIAYESSVLRKTPVNLSGYSEKGSFWLVYTLKNYLYNIFESESNTSTC